MRPQLPIPCRGFLRTLIGGYGPAEGLPSGFLRLIFPRFETATPAVVAFFPSRLLPE